MNALAAIRARSDLNLYAFPATYTDGGSEVIVGGYTTSGPYATQIANAGTRVVADIGLVTSLDCESPGVIRVHVRVSNGASVNLPPSTPALPTGATTVIRDAVFNCTSTGDDPESDDLWCRWDYGDGTISDWTGPYPSTSVVNGSHSWPSNGSYDVRMQTKDVFNYEAPWSAPLTVTVICCENPGNVDHVIGPGGAVDVSDLTFLVNYLFKGGILPPCTEEGNVDSVIGPGGPIDVSDLTFLVNYLFKGGPTPPPCS